MYGKWPYESPWAAGALHASLNVSSIDVTNSEALANPQMVGDQGQ